MFNVSIGSFPPVKRYPRRLESGKTMAKYVKAPGAEDDIHR
jgi:hypothetical protein